MGTVGYSWVQLGTKGTVGYKMRERNKLMLANEYQKLAMRTNDKMATTRLFNQIDFYTTKITSGDRLDIIDNEVSVGGLFNGCLGLAGETGEFLDMVKKAVFHEKTLDIEHAKKEIGDVLWYVAMICEAMGWNMDEIMQMNIDKLKVRYPEGFDIDKANNRQEGDV